MLSVLTVAALHYPRREVLLMGILPLQMRWLLLLYVAMDLLPLLSGSWRQSQTRTQLTWAGCCLVFCMCVKT